MYSDEGLIGEYDAAGNEIKTYGYKPNSTWSTDPLFMKQGTDYYFYHNDHLGTPQKMTNINGAVVWSATYDAFGKAAVDASSTVTNNLRFPGQYFDAETNLHYNWNRFYDSATGRYVTVDPIGFSGGDENFYRYSDGNPIINYDETGFECKNDSDCLKCITYAESRGEGSTCYKAIAWTVKNRLNKTAWGSKQSICDVVSEYKPVKQYKAYDNCNWKRCCGNEDKKCKDTDPKNKELNAVSDALANLGPDPTSGSDWFNSDNTDFTANPYWTVTAEKVPGCDKFKFFKTGAPKPKGKHK